MDISVVVPVYNEEENLIELKRRLTGTLQKLGRPYEIIFVDDGSNDRSLAKLRSFCSQDARVKVIVFDKNYGQYAALLAGIEHSQGKIIITFHSDLQYAPEDIPRFIAKMDEGYQAVGGWRVKRSDCLWKNIKTAMFNLVCYLKTGVRKRDYGCSFNALSQKTARNLREYGDQARFIKLVVTALINDYPEIQIHCHPRPQGKSKYNIWIDLKLIFDYIRNFSLHPSQQQKPLFAIQEILADENI